ncbi:MAG: cytochrome c biogenesis protein [Candidatus Nanoarchaeia archaeon]
MKKWTLIPLLIALLALMVRAECTEDTCAITNDNNSPGSGLINDEGVCVIYFYGQECSKCAEIKPYIEEIEQKYKGQIHLHKLELYHNLENYQIYNKYCNIENIPLQQRGVPLVAIGNKFFMGTSQIKEGLEPAIQEAIQKGENTCPLPDDMTCSGLQYNQTDVSPVIPGLKEKITPAVVVLAGLTDGINPCAFAVLIFLLTFLIEISSTKRRMIKAGVVYIAAVYVTYFLAGLGLLAAIQVTGLTKIIVKVAAVLAIVMGAINVKDYFWYGKGISLQIPESRKGTIQKWVFRANIPAAIVLGFLVSMFELPCTGGIYLAILAMLANTVTKTTAIYYLLVYNFMFVLPLIIILLAVTFGMKAEHIESWRQKKRNWMRLAMGLVLIGLGLALLLGWFI